MALDDTKTLAERILRLEQKLQRLEKREGRPRPEVFDNSAIRNQKIIDDLLVHNHTHANLLGLDADDHSQYLNTTRHDVTARHTLGTVVPHDDHGNLAGLTDDDHSQYTVHPASSTDNAIVRWNGTGGRTIQNSGVTIDDSNNIKVGTAPVPTSVTSSTDNAVVRFDGTGGNKIQNSLVTINDSGQLSGNGLDGWIYDTDIWLYNNATSFKINGKDVRYKFPKGTKIKLVQSGSTKYFYVIATAYSTDTVITITGGSSYTLINATISGQAYSYAAAPQNFPQWFNYTPTIYSGWSALPTGTYRFYVIGNTCFCNINMSAGTSNTTGAQIGAPITAQSNQIFTGANGVAYDNSTLLTVATRWWIGSGGTDRVTFLKDMGNGAWTASGTKRIYSLVIYEF